VAEVYEDDAPDSDPLTWEQSQTIGLHERNVVASAFDGVDSLTHGSDQLAHLYDGEDNPTSDGEASDVRSELADVTARQHREIQDAVDRTNPNFEQDVRYRVNCVHAVNAYELRRRGFDREATPLPADMVQDGGRSAEEALNRWSGPDGEPRQFDVVSQQDLVSTVEDWDVGSRGWVALSWRTGGGHILAVERTPDGVEFVEPQNATTMREDAGFMDDYLRQAKDSVRVVRVDDMTPESSVGEFAAPA